MTRKRKTINSALGHALLFNLFQNFIPITDNQTQAIIIWKIPPTTKVYATQTEKQTSKQAFSQTTTIMTEENKSQTTPTVNEGKRTQTTATINKKKKDFDIANTQIKKNRKKRKNMYILKTVQTLQPKSRTPSVSTEWCLWPTALTLASYTSIEDSNNNC